MKLNENPFVLFLLGWKAYLIIIGLGAAALAGASGLIPMPDGLSVSLIGAVLALMLGRILLRFFIQYTGRDQSPE